MGKNLYETPRNRNKWNQQSKNHLTKDQPHDDGHEDKKARLERLKKEMLKKKRK